MIFFYSDSIVDLEKSVQTVTKEIESKFIVPKELSKSKNKYKEEIEIANKILSHIYTELELEYDKRVPYSTLSSPPKQPTRHQIREGD